MPKGSGILPDFVNTFPAAEKVLGRPDERAEEYICRYIEAEETPEPAA